MDTEMIERVATDNIIRSMNFVNDSDAKLVWQKAIDAVIGE